MSDNKNGSVNMLGQEMRVLVSAGCMTDFTPDRAIQLPRITVELCKTLSMRQVARSLMLNIRIGETVALVDKNTGYTYRLQMGNSEILVLGIYDSRQQPDYPVAHTLVLVNTRLLELVNGSRRKAVAA